MTSYNILLVEDDKVDQMAFVRFIKKEKIPYNYKVAGSIAEAKTELKGNQFDIVIVDYMLGDGTGLDILKMNLATPVIFMTGTGSEEVAVKAMKQGAADYLIKAPDQSHLKTLPVTVENTMKYQRATAESQKNEMLFLSLFEQSNDPIFIADFDGTILDVNKSACALLKFERDELLNKSLVSVHANESLGHVKQAIETIKTTGVHRFDTKMRKSFGEIVDVEVSAKVIDTAKGIFHEIVRDVTNRKKKELALLQNEQTLQRVLENVQTGIIIVDPRDHRIVEINRNALELIEAPKEEVIGSVCFKYVCPSKEEECPVIAKGEFINNKESILINVRGEKIPVIKTVTSIILKGRRHLIESVVDVREQKRKENEVKAALSELNQVFNTSADAMRIVDKDLKTIRVNKTFSKLFGVSHNKAIGSKCCDIFGDGDCEGVHHAVRKILAGEKKVESEIEIQGKDGERIYCLLTVTPFLDADGKLIGVVESYKNITDRKHAEHALMESEKKYRKIFENIQDVYYRTDLTGKILEISGSVQNYAGYHPDQLKGKSVLDFYKDRRDRIRFIKEIQNKGQITDFEIKLRDEKDNTIYTSVNAHIIKDAQGNPKGMEGFLRDVTERRQAEQVIENERNRAQQYLDVAGVVFVAIEADQSVSMINKRGCQVLGYKEKEIIGKNWFDNFLPERVKEHVVEIFNQLMKGDLESVEYVEDLVLTKSGEERVIAWRNSILKNDEGKITGILSSGEDITDAKKAQEALVENEEKLKKMSSAAQDAIIMMDDDGKISYWNRAAGKIFGYKKNQVIGEDLHDLLAPKRFHDAYKKAFSKFIKSGKGNAIGKVLELSALRKNGREFPIEISLSSVKIKGKWNAIGIIRDISDRKEAENALRENEERYRTVFNNTGTATVIIEDDATLSLVNAEFEKLSGFSKQEIEGKKSFKEFVFEKDRKRMEKYHRNRRTTSKAVPKNYEFKFVDKSGNVKDIYVTIEMLPGTKKSIASLLNITQERKATEKIQKSEALLMATLESTADGILVVNNKGEITHANNRFAQMWQIPEKLMKTKNDDKLIKHVLDQLKDPTAFMSKVRSLYNSLEQSSDTLHFKDRRVFERFTSPLIQNGKNVGRVWSFRDVTEQKKAEQAIKESEEKYRALFESTADPIFIFDKETNYFLDCNKTTLDRYGYTKEELKKMKPYDLHPKEDHDLVTQNVEKDTTEPYYNHVTKSGKVFQVEILTSQVNYGNREARLSVVRDISDRKRAEEALRESEQRYRAVIESTSNGIGMADKKENLIYVNKGFAEMLGYTTDELIGKNLADLTTKEEYAKFTQQTKLRRKGKQNTYETILLHKDGSSRYVLVAASPLTEADGTFKGSMGVFTDITERRKMMEAIEQERNLLHLLMDSVPDAIYFKDVHGNFTRINQAQAANLGIDDPQLAIGKHDRDFFSDKHAEVANDDEQKIFATGEPMINKIEKVVRPDGWRLWVSATKVPIKTATGCVTGIVGISRDVTELKKIQEELEEKNKALDQALLKAEAATKAKSEFLANMSHEIRTPLNAVIGMTGLLFDTNLSDEQLEYVETVRSGGEALLGVINDILDFSKIEAGKIDLEEIPFNLRECIEESLDLHASRAAKKGLDIAYFIDQSAPTMIVGDVTRLRQIINNLLSNAIKFTNKGEILINVKSKKLKNEFYELLFSVKDTGIGIPEDRKDRLFKSFSQVDSSTTRRYGGTGLGLIISKRLSEIMNGKMWVESKVGVGSTFYFTIKVESKEVEFEEEFSSVLPQLKGKRILIVDDNEINRKIIKMQTKTWGMIAFATESPKQAIEWVKQNRHFDVAVLDLQMPEMNGIELAQEIRKYRKKSDLPIIMLTSLGRKEDRDVIDELDFSGYMTKPLKQSQLYNVLNNIFSKEPKKYVRKRDHKMVDTEMAKNYPLKILVTEDNVVNQKVALKVLDKMGYRADVAGNGLEAIEAIKRQQYDVVLMDVQMPELDGLETTRYIVKNWTKEQRPRIIAMTAGAMKGDKEKCLEAGMDDYVTKPIQFNELVTALKKCKTNGKSESLAVENQEKTMKSQTDLPAIDETVLQMLAEMDDDGENGFLKEMITIYLNESPPIIENIKKALEAGDQELFTRSAHTLKSSSANLGAMNLSQMSKELEMISKNGDFMEAPEKYKLLENEFDRVKKALEEYL